MVVFILLIGPYMEDIYKIIRHWIGSNNHSHVQVLSIVELVDFLIERIFMAYSVGFSHIRKLSRTQEELDDLIETEDDDMDYKTEEEILVVEIEEEDVANT
jgi:hypothetical protein